jgi:hypothetical protein
MGPQSKGGQPQINKPPNAIKASSQTPKKIFVCCFVAIKV